MSNEEKNEIAVVGDKLFIGPVVASDHKHEHHHDHDHDGGVTPMCGPGGCIDSRPVVEPQTAPVN
jgi:hypothetical protein